MPRKTFASSNMPRRLLAVLVAALSAGAVTEQARGQEQPRLIPPHATPDGMSRGEWGAAWWQWVLGVPASQNPQFDATGANAAAGQSGHAWFLAGNFGGTSDRTVRVPPGKVLLFPVVNVIFTGWLCVDPDEDVPIADLEAAAAEAMDTATNLFCEIDGVPVRDIAHHRGASGPFQLSLPDDNIIIENFGCDDVPGGEYGPSVSDGYWIMLAPLSPGEHTIHFGGEVPYFGDFSTDVTYHITVR